MFHILKIFFGFVFFSFFASCSSGKHATSDDAIHILRATSQPWVGGKVGSGHGINYKLRIAIGKKGVVFDSLWVEQKRLDVAPKYEPGLNPEPPFKRGDTVLLQAKYVEKKDTEQAKSSQKELKGEGLLRYERKGTTNSVVIDSFEKLPELRYPSKQN